MVYYDFFSVFQYLQDVGYFQLIAPFLLMFMVLFTLLEKTRLLGENNTVVNALIGILLASIAIFNTRVIEFMNVYLGNFTIAIVLVAVSLLLFMFILGIDTWWLKGPALLLAIFATIWTLVQVQYYDPYGDFGGYINVVIIWIRPYIELAFVTTAALLPIILIVALALYKNRRRARA